MPSPTERDVHERYESSPLDPWGLLSPTEKAAAAIRHAEMVRTPKPKPKRPARPRVPRPIPVVPPGTRCVFRHTVTNVAQITHQISRSGRPHMYPVGSFVCDRCAEVINNPDYTTHAVEPI